MGTFTGLSSPSLIISTSVSGVKQNVSRNPNRTVFEKFVIPVIPERPIYMTANIIAYIRPISAFIRIADKRSWKKKVEILSVKSWNITLIPPPSVATPTRSELIDFIIIESSDVKRRRTKSIDSFKNEITDEEAGIMSYETFVRSLAKPDPEFLRSKETTDIVLNRILLKLKSILDSDRSCSLLPRDIAHVERLRHQAEMMQPIAENLRKAQDIAQELFDHYDIDCRPPETIEIDGFLGRNVLETMYKEHLEWGVANKARLLYNLRSVRAVKLL